MSPSKPCEECGKPNPWKGILCPRCRQSQEELSSREKVASTYECIRCYGQVFPAHALAAKCCGIAYAVEDDGCVSMRAS